MNTLPCFFRWLRRWNIAFLFRRRAAQEPGFLLPRLCISDNSGCGYLSEGANNCRFCTWISWKIFIILRQYQYPGLIFFAKIHDLLADLMCIMFIQVLEMHVIFPVWLTDVVFIGKCPGCFYFFSKALQ